MIYQLNGTFDLGDNFSLENPKFKRLRTFYYGDFKEAHITVLLWIEGEQMNTMRTYVFPCESEWTIAEADAAMLSLPFFQNYTEVQE